MSMSLWQVVTLGAMVGLGVLVWNNAASAATTALHVQSAPTTIVSAQTVVSNGVAQPLLQVPRMRESRVQYAPRVGALPVGIVYGGNGVNQTEGRFDFSVMPVLLAIGAFVTGMLFGRHHKETVSMHAFHSVSIQGGRRSMALSGSLSPEEMAEEAEMLQMEAEEKMMNGVEACEDRFAAVRTGRANPGMVDRLKVDYYGAMTPLKQLAGISIPEAQQILISPFDKGAIKDIEKAIRASDLGLTPNNDGEKIRLNIPTLTADRRKEMVKLASKYAEDSKVQIRNIRRDTLKGGDKLGMSEDNAKGYKDDVQKLTDKYVKKVEDLLAAKEKDLLEM